MENTADNPQEEIQPDMYLKPKFKISWQVIFAVLMFFYMYLPILVLTFYSFNKSRFSAGWEGFTLDWYVKLFSDTRILIALRNSLTVAVCAVAISAVLGTLMAVGSVSYTHLTLPTNREV